MAVETSGLGEVQALARSYPFGHHSSTRRFSECLDSRGSKDETPVETLRLAIQPVDRARRSRFAQETPRHDASQDRVQSQARRFCRVLPRIRKVKSGGMLSRRIAMNPKVLLGEGFALVKERLGVHALLTHCRPLEAHLPRAVRE